MERLTPKQIELLRELSDQDVFGVIFENIEALIANEWRAGNDLEAREAAHAKHQVLRDVRRQIRSLIQGTDDG